MSRYWRDDALCAQVGAELFFPGKGSNNDAAKRVCAVCPVRDECLDFALACNDYGEVIGVFGGRSGHERNRRAA